MHCLRIVLCFCCGRTANRMRQSSIYIFTITYTLSSCLPRISDLRIIHEYAIVPEERFKKIKNCGSGELGETYLGWLFENQTIAEPRWDRYIFGDHLYVYVHSTTVGEYTCKAVSASENYLKHIIYHVFTKQYYSEALLVGGDDGGRSEVKLFDGRRKDAISSSGFLVFLS
ncbi:hypothetical protein RB195_001277 [Necator americanus]|uniref:Ig-like domain-containing protein n=1 Tax=Necator americanus TaxID=51031 RepID=A0ABR1DDH8_NECAM